MTSVIAARIMARSAVPMVRSCRVLVASIFLVVSLVLVLVIFASVTRIEVENKNHAENDYKHRQFSIHTAHRGASIYSQVLCVHNSKGKLICILHK